MAQPAHASVSCSTSTAHNFAVGDIVDVKGHGRASVIEPLDQLPDSPHFGRYLVRYHEDGTTYWCRPKLLRRMYPTTKRVLVARSTAAYRDAIVHNVDRPDVCLEIGCHEGLTSNIISNRASFVTGVDTAAEVVAIAARRHPHLTFHQLDGLDVGATAALSPCRTYTRICIDISGKAPLELICQMIAAQRSAFPAASLIVKNEQLFDALLLSQHHHHQQQPPPHHHKEQQSPSPSQRRSQSEEQAQAHSQHQGAAQQRTDQSEQTVEGAGSPEQCELGSTHAAPDGSPGPAAAVPPPPPLPSTTTTTTTPVTRDECMTLMRVAAAARQPQSHSLPRPAAVGSSGTDSPPGQGREAGSGPGPAPSSGNAPGGEGRCHTACSGPSDMAGAAAAATVTAPGEAGETKVEEEEARCAARQRLEALLGSALLGDCELFRHQSQPPRTRPHRRHGKAAQAAQAAGEVMASPPPGSSAGDGEAAERGPHPPPPP